ncbi:MAG: hypothetical protein IE931_03440 [Sphingobacteriales bacterium]|nr:hypothetical protein [Sphingobacteriales bacterium]
MSRNYAPIFAACKSIGLEYQEAVYEFTKGRTQSLRALSDGEVKHLQLELNARQQSNWKPKPGDKQRKKMIGLARSMQYAHPVEAVNEWCINYGRYNKPLMDHDEDELNKVLYIYEHEVYASYLRNLNRN